MVSETLKALVATSSLFFTSIPKNPDIPRPIRPELPPDFKVPEPFPLDDEATVSMDLKVIDRESKVTMTFLVEKQAEDKYLYTYTVTNDGKYPVAFRYSILDKISGTEIMLLYLKPEESRKITVESTKQPVYAEGIAQVWLLIKPDDDIWKDDIKKAGATVSGDFFHPVVGKINGAVPSGTK